MPTHWTLVIDLRGGDRDTLLFEVGLLSGERLSGERQLHWGDVRPVDRDIFEELLCQTPAHCFREFQQPDRAALLTEFGDAAGRAFALDQLLDQTVFAETDTLTIDTAVTAIPWDLVHFKGEFLGHRLAVGLRIPTIRTTFPQRRIYAKQPRFLHIVSNPYGDLASTADESQQLEALIKAEAPELEYQRLDNPDPVAVIGALMKSQLTPFVHYSGHVKPGEGLDLAKRIMRLDEIVRYFPYGGAIVFLNGCDAVYDREVFAPRERVKRTFGRAQSEAHRRYTVDMFQLASVANAFLDAGARAVIAPRTRIGDVEACDAALQIWKRVLTGEGLGTAVRHYRREKVGKEPASLAGYSFILYGSPATRGEQGSAATRRLRRETPVESVPHALVQEAWTAAGGVVAPQHLFGVLTRRWIVGHLYFAFEDQSYIETLERLRQELGLGLPERPAVDGPVALEGVATQVLEAALARGNGQEPDELAWLEALAEVDDRRIEVALQSLSLGPRVLAEFVESARRWIADGRPVPPVLVNPDGYLNRVVFLPHLQETMPPSAGTAPIDCWELVVGLVTTSSHAAQLWQRALCPTAPTTPWSVGQPLHWAQLTAAAQRAVLEAMQMRGEENQEAVTESHLMSCLLEAEALRWDELPEDARRWLASQHINQEHWHQFLSQAHIAVLGWV